MMLILKTCRGPEGVMAHRSAGQSLEATGPAATFSGAILCREGVETTRLHPTAERKGRVELQRMTRELTALLEEASAAIAKQIRREENLPEI